MLKSPVLMAEYAWFCVLVLKSFFRLYYNFPIGKHKSSKVKDVAATVHRKLKTFMEITLEEDSMER